MFRRQSSRRLIRQVVNREFSQKTKVRAIISLLSFAGNALQTATIAASSDTARANYFDTYVKPFSKIDMMHIDLALYINTPAVESDNYLDWAIIKNPGGSLTITNPNGAGLTNVPTTIRTGRAALGMVSASGIPNVYHLRGDLRIPKRLRLMAPGDTWLFICQGFTVGSNFYSVNGVVTYMFKN